MEVDYGDSNYYRKLLTENVVEWARIEFKEGWNPETTLKTISAFANDIDNWGGGYIVIGAEEKNGKVVRPVKGIEPDSVDKIQKELLRYCKYLKPVYIPQTQPVYFDGKMLLLVWCPGGYERPYACPKAPDSRNSEKIYYIRKLSSTIEATDIDVKELMSLKFRLHRRKEEGTYRLILKDIIEGHNIFYKLGFDEYSRNYIMEIDNGQGIKNYYVITEDEYEKSRNNAEFVNMLYDKCLKENVKGKRFYFSNWSQQNSPEQDCMMCLYSYRELFIGKSRKQIYQITVREKSSEKEDIYVLGNMKLSVIYQDDICVKVEAIKLDV